MLFKFLLFIAYLENIQNIREFTLRTNGQQNTNTTQGLHEKKGESFNNLDQRSDWIGLDFGLD